MIHSFIAKSIYRQQAAELLSLSPHQNTRLKKGILASGAESLNHKNTGIKPAHSVSEETKEKVLSNILGYYYFYHIAMQILIFILLLKNLALKIVVTSANTITFIFIYIINMTIDVL